MKVLKFHLKLVDFTWIDCQIFFFSTSLQFNNIILLVNFFVSFLLLLWHERSNQLKCWVFPRHRIVSTSMYNTFTMKVWFADCQHASMPTTNEKENEQMKCMSQRTKKRIRLIIYYNNQIKYYEKHLNSFVSRQGKIKMQFMRTNILECSYSELKPKSRVHGESIS